MRNNPHILEINARSWLARYEREQGRKFTLADVPAAFWEKIQEAGFDAVWLMGVWKLSTVAEKIARENEEILNQVRTSKPNFKTEDIAASPYAVYDYTVDEFFGGNEALAAFRKNLNDRGIQLFLDFVGNHTAIDAPVVEEHPELFVTTGTKAPHVHEDWFFQNKKGHYIAHGRDPYFAPWTDTAQLNYFNPKTRNFMTQKLLEVSRMCDGVRCDMAMLSLNKVQRDTWWEFIIRNLCLLPKYIGGLSGIFRSLALIIPTIKCSTTACALPTPRVSVPTYAPSIYSKCVPYVLLPITMRKNH